MTEDEINQILNTPCNAAQVLPLYDFSEANERGLQFAFLVRFPPGARFVVITKPIATIRHLLDPKLCVEFTANVRHRLQQGKQSGDDAIERETRWPSVTAAVQRLIFEFNKRQRTRYEAEDKAASGSDLILPPGSQVH